MITLLTSAIIFGAVVGFTNAGYCQEHPEPALNENIILEIAGIVLTGTVGFHGCILNDPVVDEDVKFLLFDPTIKDWVVLDRNNPVGLDSAKPIKLAVHGWGCGACSCNISMMAEAYLQRYDCNVIGIDWSARSIGEYSVAYCSAQRISDIIAEFLCVLSGESFKVDLTQQLHTIGHSLGAQILGLAGPKVRQLCNTRIGRISGLDPAGPLFFGKPPSDRLDSEDADFVDVIHSNAGGAGIAGDCGDVDFYPNCGSLQNGCSQFTSIQQMFGLPISAITCSHARSAYLWLESINPASKKFVSTSCKDCYGVPDPLGICARDFMNPKYTVMGEDCPRNPPASKFYVKTNEKSPFALG